MKICSRCSVEYELDFFRKDKRGKYGVRSICKNCDKIYNKDYYLKNKDKLIFNSIIYKKTNKWREIVRINNAHRRARIRTTSDNTISYNSLNNILKTQWYECTICSKCIKDRNTRHIDHIKPISKWWIHWIKNIQWLCCECNLRKSNSF